MTATNFIVWLIGMIGGFIGGWNWRTFYDEFKSITSEINPDYHWMDKIDLYFAIVEKRRQERNP